MAEEIESDEFMLIECVMVIQIRSYMIPKIYCILSQALEFSSAMLTAVIQCTGMFLYNSTHVLNPCSGVSRCIVHAIDKTTCGVLGPP